MASRDYSVEEQRLLLDKLAIREVLDQYWYGLGHHDIDAVLDAFSDDAHYSTASGKDEIRAIVERISGLRCINILCGSQRIEINDDTASADTQAIAFLVIEGSEPERLLLQGLRYVDRLERTDSGWRIVDRGGLEDRTIAHDISFQFELVSRPVDLLDELDRSS